MIGAAPVASNETPGAVERRAGERPIAQASNRGGRAFRVFATHAVAGPLIGGLIFWLFLFVAAFVEPTQGIARDPAAFREPLCILVDALSAVAAIAALTIPFSFYFGGPPAAAAGLVLALIAWRTGGYSWAEAILAALLTSVAYVALAEWINWNFGVINISLGVAAAVAIRYANRKAFARARNR